MRQDVREFPVSLFFISLKETEFFHPGKRPDMHVAIAADHDGFDIGVDRFRVGSKHIPGLKQAGPHHVRLDQGFHVPDGRKVKGEGDAGDGNQVKQDEDADHPAAKGLGLEVLRFWSETRALLSRGFSRDAFLPAVSFGFVHRPFLECNRIAEFTNRDRTSFLFLLLSRVEALPVGMSEAYSGDPTMLGDPIR